MAERKRDKGIMFILMIALLVLIIVSVGVGRYSIALNEIPTILYQGITGELDADSRKALIVLTVIRIPRIILAMLTGAALSASGAAYQGLFQNPMVSPDILGVSSGASVGAAVALLLDFPSAMVHVTAFLAGILAVCLVAMISRVVTGGNGRVLVMVLSGTVISSVFSALTSLIKYVADTDEKLPAITFWLMGSFAKNNSYTNVRIMLIVSIIGLLPLLALRWNINALSFGEDEASSLGVNVIQTRNLIIFSSTLLTASSICICGMVGWVGLIMPHISRLLTGANYGKMLPVSILSGAIFMLLVDNVSRVIIPGELPVGILTSLIGAPLFIYLLFSGRKEWL